MTGATPRTPVAVVAYDRPLHLRLCLEHLERCEDFAGRDVTVFCDKAAAGRESACAAVLAEARSFSARTGARVVQRRGHAGFRNVTGAVTELCEAAGTAIVIEDDLAVAPDFLVHMDQALAHFADEPRVWAVTGFVWPGRWPAKDCTFLPAFTPWGWATWQRAWQHFSWAPPDLETKLADPAWCRRFDWDGDRDATRRLRIGRGWAVRWEYAMDAQSALSLVPPRSLVWNMGVSFGTNRGAKPAPPDEVAVDRRRHGRGRRSDFLNAQGAQTWRFPASARVDERVWRLWRRRSRALDFQPSRRPRLGAWLRSLARRRRRAPP